MEEIIRITADVKTANVYNLKRSGLYVEIDVDAKQLFSCIDYELVREHYEMRIEREIYEALADAGVVKVSFNEYMKEKQDKILAEAKEQLDEMNAKFREMKIWKGDMDGFAER